MTLLAEWCEANKPELVGLFNLVQEYRKVGKLKSTYIDGYGKYVNSVRQYTPRLNAAWNRDRKVRGQKAQLSEYAEGR
ncbi:MAG: hypothetical protein LBS19_05555 [Clostridiales bacterium]|jgi:DNA polymerase I-like protein with 3'-5' exonuclease and polymerase domains|nr:hypothetical protein [Clostridiales bacterium]